MDRQRQNQIDRVFRKGFVIDFLNVGIGPVVRTGIFNIADMAITTGVALLLVTWIRDRRRAKDEAKRESLGENSPPTGENASE